MARTVRLIEAPDYAAALARDIARAKKTVVLKTMTFRVGDRITTVCRALIDAQQRGVAVALVIDRYALLFFDRRTLSMLRTMKKSGITIQWSGAVRLNPFSGRDHVKFSVVDDTVYAFGGINFKERALANYDYMLRIRDIKLADFMISRRYEAHPYTAHTYGDVLYDRGKRGESIIYQQALRAMRSCTRVVFVSKMSPDSSLLEALRTRRNATILYNTRRSGASVFTRLATRLARATEDNHYCGNRTIHAKILITTTKNHTSVITGSHNLNSLGVRFGTRELALSTHDANIVRAVERFVKHIV